MEASPHCPVRLECVMHAASVHPEPGSNSRQFSIITCFLHVITKPEFPFASFEFSRSFLPSCVLLGIVEILLCLVVQFSRTISLSLHLSFLLPSLSKAPHRTAWLFYHISYPFVNPFLKKNFFPFFFASLLPPPPSLLPLLAKNVTIFLTRLSKKADRTGHCRRMDGGTETRKR